MNELDFNVLKEEQTKKQVNFKIKREILKEEFNKVLNSVRNNALIKGFRRGKAPLEVVKEKFYADIIDKTIENLIKDVLTNYTDKDDDYIVGIPKVTKIDFKDVENDLSFVAEFEKLPKFEVKGYKKIKILKEKEEVKDEEVEKVLNNLRERIKQQKKNEYNEEEFIKALGAKDETEAKEKLKNRILYEKKQMVRQGMEEQIYDELLRKNKFEVPEYLVLERIEEIKKRIKKKELTSEEKKEIEERARKEVAIGIILAEIGKKENIEVTEEEINKKVRELFGVEKEKININYKNALKDSLLTQKILDFIISESKIKEK